MKIYNNRFNRYHTLLFHSSLQFNLVGLQLLNGTLAALEMMMNVFLEFLMNQTQLFLLLCIRNKSKTSKMKK